MEWSRNKCFYSRPWITPCMSELTILVFLNEFGFHSEAYVQTPDSYLCQSWPNLETFFRLLYNYQCSPNSFSINRCYLDKRKFIGVIQVLSKFDKNKSIYILVIREIIHHTCLLSLPMFLKFICFHFNNNWQQNL